MILLRLSVWLSVDGYKVTVGKREAQERPTTYFIDGDGVIDRAQVIKKGRIMKIAASVESYCKTASAHVWCFPEQEAEAIEMCKASIVRCLNNEIIRADRIKEIVTGLLAKTVNQ